MQIQAVLPTLPEEVIVRIAGRLGMQFFLSYLRIVCDGRDLLDGLLLSAIAQANLGHLDDGGKAQDRYLSFEDAPPLDRVRPISVNALASSLRFPYETLRRRTKDLAEAGACEVTKGGLILPPAYYGSAHHRVLAFSVSQQVRTLFLGLAALGLLKAPRTGEDPGPAPVIGVLRLASEYCLRQLEAMTQHIDDPTVGVMLIQVIRLSTDHLDDTPTEFSETQDLVRDDLRRPIAVSTLAARSGIPLETTRRHARTLIDRGWIARAPAGGLYLTREMLRSPPWPDARRENVINLSRMFRGLGAMGALEHWSPPAAG